MNILALHCATGSCSVAAASDGEIVDHRSRAMARGHAEAIVPMVCETMRGAGLAYADLDRIAVTVGPGTFTGLRIGLAAARGLALAARIPLFGVTTLEAVAHATEPRQDPDAAILATIETKRSGLFAQLFADPTTPLSEPRWIEPDELANWVGWCPQLVVGDGAERAAAALVAAGVSARRSASAHEPDARVVAAIVASRDAPGNDRQVQPVYLSAPLVTPPRDRGMHA